MWATFRPLRGPPLLNVKLRDLAAQLVDTHERDELDAILDKFGRAP
jgi:hypothetical protein